MALLEEGERRIGENVRAARHYRGMSLETLAGLVGRSKGWLSKIENGSARLERRTDIAAIADALEVSASDIIGEAAPIIRSGRSHDYDAIPLRDILLETTLDDPSDIRPRPLREVTADAANVRPAWDAVDYAGLCHLLPRVIGDLQVIAATAATGEREDALRNLIDVCIVATWILRHIGRIDSAWIAAE